MTEISEKDRCTLLARLFYSFRLSHLNQRYYAMRLTRLKRWNSLLSIVVMIATAASFALLTFASFHGVTTVAAIIAVVGFLASVVVPLLGLERKIDDASSRTCAFHYAAQQLESALRFVRNSEQNDGEMLGWTAAAEAAYYQAAALPDTEAEDRKLVKKVEGEINEAFPPSYVWLAF